MTDTCDGPRIWLKHVYRDEKLVEILQEFEESLRVFTLRVLGYDFSPEEEKIINDAENLLERVSGMKRFREERLKDGESDGCDE
jgi:hypothetical protein